MKCENCSSKHTGEYGSGRFCNVTCARGFSTKAKRKEINAKVSLALRGLDYLPQDKADKCICCGNKLKRNARFFCGLKCMRDYEYLIFINRWQLGLESGTIGKCRLSNRIKRFLKEKWKNSCQKCGWSIIHPTTGTVPLEVHHVDGNYLNNKEDNLELLCPNCHTLTPNFRSLNKNNPLTGAVRLGIK